jgi:diguanylate cyclase (GGDEF)-like protein
LKLGLNETFPRVLPDAVITTKRLAGRARPRLNDELTRLLTRAAFLARLRRSIAPDWCMEGLFVLLMDVDRFREINERFGYVGGDQLLVEIAARLKRRLRPSDGIARFGPDEFAVLLCGAPSAQSVGIVAERLLAELAAPVAIEGVAVKPAVSIGVAMGMAGGRPEDVVRDAERALGKAKLFGKSNYQIFQSDMDARETALLQVEIALRRALDQEEFRARYRPTVMRKEGSVASFEVLLWRRSAPMSVAPGERGHVEDRGA